MGQFRTSRLFDVFFLLVITGSLFWAAANRVAVGDWVYFLSYHPDAKTIQVADAAGFTPLGRRLFYRTDPEFASRDVVSKACDVEELGCITPQGRVYILDEPDQPDRTVVTAAHEMLHLAYRRLPSNRLEDLGPLIDEGVSQNKAGGIMDELRGENNTADQRDEAHSLLGTEYKDLPAELEHYYTLYFTNRSKVLAAEAASEQR